MKVVHGYGSKKDRTCCMNDKRLSELKERSYRSFHDVGNALKDNESVTVEIAGKGFKNVSREKGQIFVQRNFAYEW